MRTGTVISDPLLREGPLMQYSSPIRTRNPNLNSDPNSIINPKLTQTLNAINTWSSHAHARNANSDEIEHFALIVAIFGLTTLDVHYSTVLSYK